MRPLALALIAGAIVLAAPAPARAESMFCAILEPHRDGNVFVSSLFALPGDPDEDAAAAVYARAFEKLVRSRYSFDSTQPLINLSCVRDEKATAEADHAKLYRRKGNTKGGAVIRTDVSWSPDAALHRESREQRAAEREYERVLLPTETVRGYLYCKHVYEDSADEVTITFSEVMRIPGGARISDFAGFAEDRFRTAVIAQRKKDNRPHAGRDYVTCDAMGRSKGDVEHARDSMRAAAKAPVGGDSFGEPDQRELRVLALSTFLWTLDAPGYTEYGKLAAAFDARLQKLRDAVRFATNARRRRDCMAGKTASCGPAPVP